KTEITGRATFFLLPFPNSGITEAIVPLYPIQSDARMFLPLALFAIGLILLVKGADFAVRGAESLAVKIGVSPTTIGLTVVAFGTSLPELVVSTEAFRRGDYAIGTGNVVGSNIVNIGLILALALFIMPAACSTAESRSRLLINTVLTLGAASVFAIVSLRGYFDFITGIVFLLIFSGMLFLMWKPVPVANPPDTSHSRHPVLLTLAGLAMVILGAHLLLKGAVDIAEMLSVPPAVIGLSMVAVGTSLPELATSFVAAMKRSPGIAVGNVLGSNIFNLLFIIGINSLFFTIPAPAQIDTIVMIGFSLAVFPFFIRSTLITRIWSGVLLGAYTLYILFLFGLL
ncbi:MAG: sodium:calcium antiporter, partial [Methanoregulaceae archaeon]|nr:sodium:calcium antiporter [Methanoregulaceae archaeon]